MIGSPDLLAFTTETDFTETPTELFALPEELSVPLHPHSENPPWSKTAKFNKDFILISEFSEQVGPQPVLTIPDETTALGSFDLNHFSLRIMSVDYQTTFAGPGSCGYPKLNFVEDSKVVLGDSREGAYSYVHHLTLYDLDARGLVRPFCMAYVSSEEEKIMHGFRQLSAKFSKASECLKTGNRKNFANELDKKLADLEYTRLVLLREIKRDRLSNFDVTERNKEETTMNSGPTRERDKKVNNKLLLATKEEELKEKRRCRFLIREGVEKNNGTSGFDTRGNESDSNSVVLNNGEEREGKNRSEKREGFEQLKETDEGQSAACQSILWPNKAEELARIEKAIQEHRSLLKQITSYPNRKLREPEFLPYEPDDVPHPLESDLDSNMLYPQVTEPEVECSDGSHATSHTPQLVSSSLCRQFDKRLKNLDELCDEYFLQQALKQLRSIEKSFRGDNSYLVSQQLTHNLLNHLKFTNFLFEDLRDLGAETGQFARRQPQSARLLPVSPLQSEPVSLESYTSCVEMVPIRLDMHRNGRSSVEPDAVPVSPFDDPTFTPDFPIEGDCKNEEGVSVQMKDSISSGESIEVLGTEKCFRTQGPPLYTMETVPYRPTAPSFPAAAFEGRKRRVATQRENSEDGIEVLSTTESIIPDDLRASYPSAIDEESREHERDEEEDRQKDKAMEECMRSAVLVEDQDKRRDCQSPSGNSTIVINAPDPHRLALNLNYLDSCTIGGLSPIGESGALQERPFQLAADDLSDCTSYLSLASTVSEPALFPGLHGEKSAGGSRRKRARLGRAALHFLRQFPFAVHAMYSLLSGRTLVVLGSEETVVRRCVTALTIYTPHLGRYSENIQPWTSGPLQITDLLTLKLIGFNRMASPSSPSMPPCLVRYGRYLSVLDVDQKTLRCPAYKGSLICPLAEARTRIMRGNTYFLYTRSVISKLVSKAFLLTFSRSLQHPSNPSETARAERFLSEFHNDDLKIIQYLSELITWHVTGTPSAVLRFSYTASTVFKL